eukprot:1023077-Rhodomonas_salina.2
MPTLSDYAICLRYLPAPSAYARATRSPVLTMVYGPTSKGGSRLGEVRRPRMAGTKPRTSPSTRIVQPGTDMVMRPLDMAIRPLPHSLILRR